MFGVGIFCMDVIMGMIVAVTMTMSMGVLIRVTVVMPVVAVVVVMMVRMIMPSARFQPAHASAEAITECAIFDVRTGRRGALAFNMVVVAFLYRADLGFKAQDLCAVFT